MSNEEWFPLIDEQGKVIGKATRRECHNGSRLLHPVVHLHILNPNGELYLQKRSKDKDIQPGKWDTAVGGHVDYGETTEEALAREVREELGVTRFTPHPAISYIFDSDREQEMVHAFFTIYDGEITIDPVEIEEGRYWTFSEIRQNIGKAVFTPNFEQEFLRIEPMLLKAIGSIHD